MFRTLIAIAALVALSGPLQAQKVEKAGPWIGLNVFASDGLKLGHVRCVVANDTGKVQEILFNVGGFLGFGGKIVAVPEGRFQRRDDLILILLGMTSHDAIRLDEDKRCAK